MAEMNTQSNASQSVRDSSGNGVDRERHEPIPAMGEIGLNQFVPYLMNRIMGRWNSNLNERMLKKDLTTVKMRILAVLSIHSGLTINELSVYTVIEQSTISRSLDRMQDQGLIRRQMREGDGRIREIHIMDKGRTIFDEFWPEMYRSYESLFDGIEPAEREMFIKTLHKLLNNIREREL